MMVIHRSTDRWIDT